MNPGTSSSALKLETGIKTNKYFANRINTNDYIVIHHTGKGNDLDLVKYLAYNRAQVSCHYVITRDGTVYKIAEDRQCTWHAGVSSRKGKNNINYHGIGIEVVSDGYNFTDSQRASVRKLISLLMDVHNLDNKAIIRHKDISPGRKRDIGDNFWNKYFPSWTSYQESFTTNSSQYNKLIQQAKSIGIWNGEREKDPSTRKEVAAMIMNAINYLQK